MKKKIVNLFALIALVTLALTSCQKEKAIEVLEPEVVLNDFNEKSSALEELAFSTASALVDPEFRKQIKDEAMKQFDGDYDILYSKLDNSSLKSGGNGSNFYLNKLSSLNKSSNSKSEEAITNLINQVPRFQIAAVNCESWNTENQIPLVTYVPVNFDEKTFTKVKAFDNEGNIHWLELNKTPDFPVIVLGNNERTDDEGNFIYTEDTRKNGTEYPVDPPCDDCGGGGGGGGGGGYTGITTATVRTNGLGEYIGRIKFTDISDYEAWILGKPEIRLQAYSASGVNLASGFWNPIRHEVDNTWKILNYKLFNWYWADYGNFLCMSWVEEDGGSITHIPVVFSAAGLITIEVQVPVTSSHDVIGNKVVNKMNSKSTIFQIDSFFWQDNF